MDHLKDSGGYCPTCRHTTFMYPRLTKVHETKDYPSSSFRYTYEFKKDRNLAMLLAEENQIWEHPIHQWWAGMSEEKWQAIDEFVENFNSNKSDNSTRTTTNDQF
ncbi:MAG: hypothetical protein WC334_09915 [Kiritimatiellales bacterium]